MSQVSILSSSEATGIGAPELLQQLSALPAGLVPGLTACLHEIAQLVDCFFA
jgi:hypothetical protein